MRALLYYRVTNALALAGILTGITTSAQGAATEGYRQINLVADQTGIAPITDTNLVNPWGLLAGAGGHLVVADNHAGVTTFYNQAGRPLPFVINIPAPDGSPGGAVTDLAVNHGEGKFHATASKHRDESLLVFVTEDGTICSWSPEVDLHNAVVVVDNSGTGAIYKGMAVTDSRHSPRLFAANFGQGVVEAYDSQFHLLRSFTDSGLASAGYVPFGIRIIAGRLLVTFAYKASPSDDDETAGPGLGYVVEFDLNGDLVRRFASQGPLNAPWGLAEAPRGFGKFSGALLVGNFGDGAINAYDPRSGAFLGQLADAQGNVIHIEGLWGLAFGAKNDSLYFTAGPVGEEHGLLGLLRAEGSSHRGRL